jgi:hypothetical protein
MKTFIKTGNEWSEETDQLKVLNAEEGTYVFAETIREAVDYINVHFNKLYPHFKIVEVSKQWSYGRKNPGSIKALSLPQLCDDVPFDKVVDLVEEHQVVSITSGYNLKRKWEAIGKNILEHGIILESYKLRYNPKEARKEFLREYRRKNYKKKPRKHFIRMHEIASVNYKMESTIKEAFRELSSSVSVDINTPRYSHELKTETSSKFIALTKFMNSIYGKYSYRQLEKFQQFKAIWKKEKPQSHITIDVYEEFFDFMELEITRRKPKNRELKPKWKLKNT